MNFLFPLLLVALSALGATVNVSSYGDGSCSYSNALAAYGDAATGDTISFPSGSCIWTQTLTISKAVSLVGNGTTLTSGITLDNGLFYYTGVTSAAVIRITGFTLVATNNDASGSLLKVFTDVDFSNLRIDNNTAINGYEQMFISGCKGVINNNTFRNPLKGLNLDGGSTAQASNSWNDMSMGTANAMFVEDNHFERDNAYISEVVQEFIGTRNGGKLVIRSNYFDATTFTNTYQMTAMMAHGSAAGGVANGYWQQGTGARRGQSTIEFYNNRVEGKRFDYLFITRGSASLVFSNWLNTTINNPSAYAYEEEQYVSSNWSPLRTNWPAEDQVHNTFIWGNTLMLNGVTNFNYFSIADTSTNFIQLGRDYWTNAPAATGGYEYFTGANGASSTYPTDGDTYPTFGTMVFTNTGPNAYYGYVPYTYPHPLRATAIYFPFRKQ